MPKAIFVLLMMLSLLVTTTANAAMLCCVTGKNDVSAAAQQHDATGDMTADHDGMKCHDMKADTAPAHTGHDHQAQQDTAKHDHPCGGCDCKTCVKMTSLAVFPVVLSFAAAALDILPLPGMDSLTPDVHSPPPKSLS